MLANEEESIFGRSTVRLTMMGLLSKVLELFVSESTGSCSLNRLVCSTKTNPSPGEGHIENVLGSGNRIVACNPYRRLIYIFSIFNVLTNIPADLLGATRLL